MVVPVQNPAVMGYFEPAVMGYSDVVTSNPNEPAGAHLCAHVCSYISKFNTCFTLADLFVLHDYIYTGPMQEHLGLQVQKKETNATC